MNVENRQPGWCEGCDPDNCPGGCSEERLAELRLKDIETKLKELGMKDIKFSFSFDLKFKVVDGQLDLSYDIPENFDRTRFLNEVCDFLQSYLNGEGILLEFNDSKKKEPDRFNNTEVYYAELESSMNDAEEAYFNARPSINTEDNKKCFRAGFERAFKKLWMK